ncbi:MAG: hypothetical protein ACI4S4_06300 [Candidatus Ornithospirochaeta sp.]
MLKNDLRLLFREGIIPLYALVTFIYAIVMSSVPSEWRSMVSRILIFSDPSALGLYFMGAVVLTEKSQHMDAAFSVLPVSSRRHVLSKTIAMIVPSIVSALILAYIADVLDIVLVFGTVIGSITFTLLGIIISSFVTELNTYILLTIPIMAATASVSVIHMIGLLDLSFLPPVTTLEMVFSLYPGTMETAVSLLSIIALFFLASSFVRRDWTRGKGAAI